MKIGILGGTFNPVHKGHLLMAEAAYRQLLLDKVLLMPSGKPPHKNNFISGQHRLSMIELAIDGFPYMEASDFELKREGTIYTADTLFILNEMYPYNKYYFIIGADSFNDIDKWYHPEIILSKASIAVCARDNSNYKELNKRKEYLNKIYKANIFILDFDCVEVSSSDIRNYFACNSSTVLEDENKLKSCITKEVIEYIIANNLYN